MAVSGIVLLRLRARPHDRQPQAVLSKEELNVYGEALRDVPGHLLPRTVLLWALRIGLIAAFVLHILAAYSLTR